MNAPYNPQQAQKTPDIYLSGSVVEQMLMHLNNGIIFAKSQDGSMRPFVDPQPLLQVLIGAIQQAMNPPEKSN
jgi:hypothetical protein